MSLCSSRAKNKTFEAHEKIVCTGTPNDRSTHKSIGESVAEFLNGLMIGTTSSEICNRDLSTVECRGSCIDTPGFAKESGESVGIASVKGVVDIGSVEGMFATAGGGDR